MNPPYADLTPEPGVSLTLARLRSATLSRVTYDLLLTLPADAVAPVTGAVTVRFTLTAVCDVVFDFAPALNGLRTATVNGVAAEPQLGAEHIAIPAIHTRAGKNEVRFEFVSDSAALNRQADFLFSLFVPARARFVFPCFDQPDLKARFTLRLEVPPGWEAVSNTPIDADETTGKGRQIRFHQTEPLPTYLFAFAAGRLAVERGSRGGTAFQIWHREHDRELLDRNLDSILDLHAKALSWLESYTGIPYPFSQFAIVLVPSFQFSGMEHPGAILYNAGRLLLESSATEHDHLTRASLIAHETAHIWFGDFVTMRWFDDVWMKEVFANFVAEKVVAQVYPEQDHDLRFLLANHPAAYAVDRSGGANAIRQPLENLSDAGQLYGPIIYLKAPIVLRQLELMLGEDRFRNGVREFLREHRFGNATWDDLLTHLAGDDQANLREWSRSWLEEPGRPCVRVETSLDSAGRLTKVTCQPTDPAELGRTWLQRINITLGYPDRVVQIPMAIGGEEVSAVVSGEQPAFVLSGGGGLGYGRFPLDRESLQWLLDRVDDVPDALTRGVAYVTLWEELLEGTVAPGVWFETAVRALSRETEGQNVEHLLAVVTRAFWLFLSIAERDAVASSLEACLTDRLGSAQTTTARASWFAALVQLTTTPSGCAWLEAVWRRQEAVRGLSLRESDETTLALELVVRSDSAREDIVDVQRGRIEDAERMARFAFIVPAVSCDALEREGVFARLGDRRSRIREPWVLTALQYLNHPLRQAHARRFIRPGLELLPEIKRTGDIFFPARWTDALLRGHASPAAAAIVRAFLADSPDLPPRLRNTVLIAADLLFRAESRPR